MNLTDTKTNLCYSQSVNSEMPDNGIGVMIFEACICLLMNAVALIGNLLVCLAVYKNHRLRTTTNLYIVSLAGTDLLSATLVMPFTAGVLITRKWPFGTVYCFIHGFLVNFGLFVSTSIMGLTAFNRYVRIVKTTNYSVIFSRKKSRTMLICLCVFIAGFIIVPQFAGLQKIGFLPHYASCHIIHLTKAGMIAHYSIVLVLFLTLPFGVAIFCYFKVFAAIQKHNLEVLSFPGELTFLTSLERKRKIRRRVSTSSIKRQIKKFVFVVVKWTSKKCVPKSVNHMKRLLELTRGHICFSEFLKMKRRYFHSSLGKQTVL